MTSVSISEWGMPGGCPLLGFGVWGLAAGGLLVGGSGVGLQGRGVPPWEWANPVRSCEHRTSRRARTCPHLETKAIRYPRADRLLRLLTVQIYPLPLRDDHARILHNAGLQ